MPTPFQLYAARFAAIRRGVPRGVIPPPITALSDAPAAPAVKPAAQAGSPVVVYAADGCPYCQQAKGWLKQRGVAFTEKDVDDETNAEDAQRLSGQDGVPVVQIGTQVIVGFDPGRFALALR